MLSNVAPRRTPPNPFARPDLAAETAICGAFIALDFRGETPCASLLGRTAKQILLSNLGPDLTITAAADRIRAALLALHQRNALDMPGTIFETCVLMGEYLHPELRAHLGLPPTPPIPVKAPNPTPDFGISLIR